MAFLKTIFAERKVRKIRRRCKKKIERFAVYVSCFQNSIVTGEDDWRSPEQQLSHEQKDYLHLHNKIFVRDVNELTLQTFSIECV
jgi:hypothetical protein